MAWRHQFGEALAPFDEHRGGAVEQFVEAQRSGVARAVQAIQVHVIDGGWRTVFMDQREGGAGNLFDGSRAQAFDNTFGERGLASAEFADQEAGGGRRQSTRQAAAEGDGLLLRAGAEDGHTPPTPPEDSAADRSRSGISR